MTAFKVSAQQQARLSQLLDDLSAFSDEAKLVRDVFEDTRGVFHRLSTFPHRRHVSETAALNELDEASIKRVYQKSPGLVVLGRVYLRSRAVNLIVGESILPDPVGVDQQWRMIRVQSGRSRMLRTVYRDDDLSDEFEMADVSSVDFDKKAHQATRAAGKHGGTRPKSWLGEDDVRVPQDENDTSPVFIEATLPSPLLEKVQVTACASHSPGKANVAVDQAAKGILPFFIFCLDLNQQISKEVRVHAKHVPFC